MMFKLSKNFKYLLLVLIMMFICCFPDNTPAMSVSTFCSSFEGDKLISKQKSLKSVTMKLICKKAALSFYLCTCREKGEEKKRTRINNHSALAR